MFSTLRKLIFLLILGVAVLLVVACRQKTAPGPIQLAVDASQAPQKILHAHLQIPVQPGPLTLYYPEWIPGEHMPDGPIINVAGLKFVAGGKTVSWRRDLLDGFTFHLDIPQGASSLDVDLDFLLSAAATGFSAGASATANLDVLSWNQVVLYPQGYRARDLMFEPSLRLPAGWKFGTALPGAKQNGDTIEFSPVSLDTLVDSPVISGRYFRAIQLTPGKNPPHEMDIAADAPAGSRDASGDGGAFSSVGRGDGSAFSAARDIIAITIFCSRSAIRSRSSASSIMNRATTESANTA